MSRSAWRLAAVVGLQVAILAAIPLRQAKARLSGRELTLETVPVDPYDVLSGYYVTLRYAAELPYVDGPDADAGPAWIVVAPGSPAWRPVECVRSYERPAGGDRVAIAAEVERGRCRIPSAGRFYLPEARRREVDQALGAVQGRGLVDLRVDDEGRVALVRLRAGSVVVGADVPAP